MNDLTIIENGLVPIYKGESGQIVDARELHEFLESKQEFTNWIKGRVEKYGFIENEDFTIILSKSTGGRPSTEYALTIDTAKEIAMVENNEQGRIIRKYFIEVEKRVRQPKQVSQAELTAMIAQNQVEIERKANTALEIATNASRQITKALDIFTTPLKDDWRHEMNEKVNQMCLEHGLSYLQFRHDIYVELESTAKVDLHSRQLRLRARMKKNGSTVADCKAISKIDIVERDPKLKPIFEGIVRKYQAKYAVA
jgi:phage anti-repressor protein